jgi:hypothetical protein
LEYYKKVVTILRCLTDLPVRINLKWGFDALFNFGKSGSYMGL